MSNYNVRTAAIVNAIIDALNATAADSGVPVDGGELTILTLEAKAAAAIEKFEKASADYEAQAAVRSISTGDAVTFQYGRAATKAIHSGTVIGVAQDKTGLQFNVLSGEGINSRTYLIGAAAVLLTADDVSAVELEIEEAQAEAKRLADEKAAASA